jgi:hypothetical protein
VVSQGVIPVVANRRTEARNVATDWNPAPVILHRQFPCLLRHKFLTRDFPGLRQIPVCGRLSLFRPKLNINCLNYTLSHDTIPLSRKSWFKWYTSWYRSTITVNHTFNLLECNCYRCLLYIMLLKQNLFSSFTKIGIILYRYVLWLLLQLISQILKYTYFYRLIIVIVIVFSLLEKLPPWAVSHRCYPGFIEMWLYLS